MLGDPQFWVLIAFIIFIAAIFNPVRKILLTTLDGKIQEIKSSINQAEKLKTEAQITLSNIKKRQNKVKNEIDLIYQEAKEKISVIEKNSYIKLKELINKRNNLASIKIEQLTRDVNTEIQENISYTVIAAIVKILEKKLNDNEKQKLINQSIKELDIAQIN